MNSLPADDRSTRHLPSRHLQDSLGWLALALIILVQWGFVASFFGRELAPFHPIGYDQSGYLTQAYNTFDHMLKDGFWKGLGFGLSMKLPQGKMMHLQAALWMLFTGPSRAGAISLNFLYFALLEFSLVYTLHWLTRCWSVAFLGLGLLLLAQSRFLMVGGIFDFRLDSIALCLYGIFLCLVIRSNVFLSRPWSLAAGAAAGMLILFRFLTAVTIALVIGVVLVQLTILVWRGRGAARSAAIRRLGGLISAAALTALLISPALWLARVELFGYYLGELGKNNDKIRAVEFGAQGFRQFWFFYPNSLITDHLGMVFVGVALLISLTLLAVNRFESPRRTAQPSTENWLPVLFLVTAFLVPLIVLTIYPTRNPIVANVLVVPVIGLIMAFLLPLTQGEKSPILAYSLVGLLALTGCCVAYTEASMAARVNPMGVDKRSAREVLKLYDDMFAQSARFGWTSPRLMMDRLQDYMVAVHLTTLTYERKGVFILPQVTIGSDIRAASRDAALAALKSSDLAVITDVSSAEGPGFVYPFNASMKAIQSELVAAAQQEMIPVGHYRAYAHSFTLYSRPSLALRLEGESGGWVTSKGVTVTIPQEFLRDRHTIELTGTTFATAYLSQIHLRAQLETGGAFKDEPCELDLPIALKDAVNYRILVKLSPKDVVTGPDARIKLSFDKFFVPKLVGMNEDTRELVILAPLRMQVLP